MQVSDSKKILLFNDDASVSQDMIYEFVYIHDYFRINPYYFR